MNDVPAFSPWPPLGSAADLARRFGAAALGDTCASAPVTWPTADRFEVGPFDRPVYVWNIQVRAQLHVSALLFLGVPW